MQLPPITLLNVTEGKTDQLSFQTEQNDADASNGFLVIMLQQYALQQPMTQVSLDSEKNIVTDQPVQLSNGEAELPVLELEEAPKSEVLSNLRTIAQSAPVNLKMNEQLIDAGRGEGLFYTSDQLFNITDNSETGSDAKGTLIESFTTTQKERVPITAVGSFQMIDQAENTEMPTAEITSNQKGATVVDAHSTNEQKPESVTGGSVLTSLTGLMQKLHQSQVHKSNTDPKQSKQSTISTHTQQSNQSVIDEPLAAEKTTIAEVVAEKGIATIVGNRSNSSTIAHQQQQKVETVNQEQMNFSTQNQNQSTTLHLHNTVKPQRQEQPQLYSFNQPFVKDLREVTSNQQTTMNQTEGVAKTIIEQLVHSLSLQLNDNRTQIRILLQPETLGEIFVKVKMENGRLQAEIDVTNPTTKALLEANLPQLRDSLLNRGIEMQKIEIVGNTLTSANDQENRKELKEQKIRQGNRYFEDETTADLGYNTIEITL